ncbi:type I DNA topoisomerase [Patescibacteria group bacterium]
MPGKKLVIVESPTKAKTLSNILDKNYVVKASNGHIRDLPKSGLGVDVEGEFEPEYVVSPKGKKVLRELKKSAKESESIVLATDLDREGEAIAWHLQYLLTPKKGTKPHFERVIFHELTKGAIEEAFKHPGEINDDLVDSQQARRVLDRLVGYKLSPLLWKKVRYGLSAGRVQSVAVRLIVEKERERDEFKPDEYWNGNALFSTEVKEEFEASLNKKDGKKLEIKDERQANQIKSELKEEGINYKVTQVKQTQRKRNPYAPFKTSTLQQTAANTFGMSARNTMRAAQKLFEKGLITYHRTDSLSMSPQFVNQARDYIAKEFGKEFLPDQAIFYKTKSKGAQEAHEAIRPTSLNPLPSSVKGAAESKIYALIYKRSLECQMLPAIYDQTSILIESSNAYEFKANGSVISFLGWLEVGKRLGIGSDLEKLNELPKVSENESVELKKLDMSQHFTQPPARYSDASLIKKLEELGIGRPSTYAPTISTIRARGYVVREGRYFKPEDVAYVVTDLLVEHFPKIVSYEFTAEMENNLDEIAHAKREWVPMIKDFYGPFEKELEKKDGELNKHDVTNLGEVGEKCPDCEKELIFKLGKYGKFVSCSNYPECKFARPLEEDKVTDENGEEVTDFGKCTECKDGTFVLKRGKFGKFLACSNYPDCKTTKPFLEKIGMECPDCEKGEIVVKKAKGRTFYGCSEYPNCEYSSWKNPLQEKQD